jgi:hypothetical protein
MLPGLPQEQGLPKEHVQRYLWQKPWILADKLTGPALLWQGVSWQTNKKRSASSLARSRYQTRERALSQVFRKKSPEQPMFFSKICVEKRLIKISIVLKAL